MQLGVDAERLKRRIFAGAALLTAAVVAFAGPIGFVGLIVPHVLRGCCSGQDNRLLVSRRRWWAAAIFLLAGRHAGAQRRRAGRAVGGRDHRRSAARRSSSTCCARAHRVSAVSAARRVRAASPSRYPRPARARGRLRHAATLSFAVEPGEIFGVIGPNSAGKTTLIRLLTRVLTPDARRDPARRRARSRALSRAAAGAAGRGGAAGRAARLSVHASSELVLMGRYPHAPGRFFESDEDRALARQAMDATGVLELAARPLDQLSGRRAPARDAGARAGPASRGCSCSTSRPRTSTCATRPSACGAAAAAQRASAGSTVLLVSHDLDLAAEVCDRLLLLGRRRGGARGPAGRRCSSEACCEAVFGCRVAGRQAPASGRRSCSVAWPRAGTHEGGDERPVSAADRVPDAREAGAGAVVERRSRHGRATVSGERRPDPAALRGSHCAARARTGRPGGGDDPRVRRPVRGRGIQPLSQAKGAERWSDSRDGVAAAWC